MNGLVIGRKALLRVEQEAARWRALALGAIVVLAALVWALVVSQL